MTPDERKQLHELLKKARSVVGENCWVNMDNLGKITAVKVRGECLLISENNDGSFSRVEMTDFFD